MDCEGCGKPLVGKQKRFCSRSCQATLVAGKNKNRIPKVCVTCGAFFEVPLCRDTTAKCCSRRCTAKYAATLRDTRGPNNPMWKGGTYRRFRKDACERCGSDRFLVVHHRDENRDNNDLSNLETLCKRCHQLHHDCAKNLPQNRRVA